MYKLGIITDEVSQDIHECIKFASLYGIKNFELRSVFGKHINDLNYDDMFMIKQNIEEAGIKICGLSSSVFKCDLYNESEILSNIENYRKMINIANYFGAKYIRIFTFWRTGYFDDVIEKIVLEIKKLIKDAEKNGLILLIENEPSTNATNASKVAEIIKKLSTPTVKALWDPGNDIYDPYNEIPYPDGYDIIKNYMAYFHLKDAKRIGDKVEATIIGEGDVNIKGQLKSLIDDNYEGYVVLETHYRKDKLSEELLSMPQGYSFSYGGFEASKLCMENYLKLISEIGGRKNERKN